MGVQVPCHELARRKKCKIEEGHGGGDRVLEREKLDLDCAECGTQAAHFLGHKFWAKGYFVSTVGRDEEMIRTYITNQEIADKQLDQLQLKLASS